MAARVEPQVISTVQQPVYPPPVAMQPPGMGQTTVVVQQPTHGQGAPQRNWTTGICGCFDDMGICLYAFLCPSCFLSSVAADMGESCIMPCCVPSPLIPMRAAWRNRQNIRGSIQNDCCAAAFCFQCAMCQLAIDIKQTKKVSGY